MKIANILYKNKKKIIFILFILLNFFNAIISFDTSLLKINYFANNYHLYYVNAINNDNGDVYIEYWGEETKNLYLSRINGTSGEELYFGDSKTKIISKYLNSIYHESIIINYNNVEYILSINAKYYDFININTGEFSYQNTKDIFFEDAGKPAFRNSLYKLNNNNYLLSMVLKEAGLLFDSHQLLVTSFSFAKNNINKIKNYKSGIDYGNSTTCFQTESLYIQCSYNRRMATKDVFTVSIFDPTSLKEKNYQDLDGIKDSGFTKMFHIKGEIGAYIYFNLDTNLPMIQIKKLNLDELKLFNIFDPLTLNGNGRYTLTNGLFYSDGIKISNSKLLVVLTSENILNLLICCLIYIIMIIHLD